MSKLLEDGIEAVRRLPEDRQDLVGEMLLAIAGLEDAPRYRPTDEQMEAIRQGMAEADAGQFVSDEELTALLKKCGQ